MFFLNSLMLPKIQSTWQDYWCIIVFTSTRMATRSAYLHFHPKNSKGIFHGTIQEINVKGIAFYHHWMEIVQIRARSNYVSMFTWWQDFGNSTRDAQKSWWWSFFGKHHSPKGATNIGGQLYTWMHNNIVNPVMFPSKLEIYYIPQWQSLSPCSQLNHSWNGLWISLAWLNLWVVHMATNTFWLLLIMQPSGWRQRH